jgi:hypothetical protein
MYLVASSKQRYLLCFLIFKYTRRMSCEDSGLQREREILDDSSGSLERATAQKTSHVA